MHLKAKNLKAKNAEFEDGNEKSNPVTFAYDL